MILVIKQNGHVCVVGFCSILSPCNCTESKNLFLSVFYQVSLQSLENFLCLFHYVQHHPNHSTKDVLKFWYVSL